MKKVIVLLSVLSLMSCKPTSFALVEANDKIHRLIISEKPPKQVTNTQEVTGISGWSLESMTISPNCAYGVIGLLDRDDFDGHQTDAEIRIYNLLQNKPLQVLDNDDITQLIKDGTGLKYDDRDIAYIVFGFAWKTVDEVIMEIQPILHPSIESLPQNVSLVYDVGSKQVVEAQFYSRTATSPISAGNFPDNYVYSYSVDNGNLIIEGNIVQNDPNGIKKAAVATLKK